VIRVVVAEDQSMVLGALVALLRTARDIEVVGTASNGIDAVKLVKDHKPNVLLSDIEMPGLTGIEAAAEITRLGLSTRVIMLTTFARPGYLRRALEAGAAGYLLKDSPPETLADAVRRVHMGLRAFDPDLAREASDAPNPLTDRERQALRLTGDGLSGPDIAAALNLSEGTVRNYLSEAMNKLRAATRNEAARVARDNGWL
jgi:two-component system response regulator DesR